MPAEDVTHGAVALPFFMHMLYGDVKHHRVIEHVRDIQAAVAAGHLNHGFIFVVVAVAGLGCGMVAGVYALLHVVQASVAGYGDRSGAAHVYLVDIAGVFHGDFGKDVAVTHIRAFHLFKEVLCQTEAEFVCACH